MDETPLPSYESSSKAAAEIQDERTTVEGQCGSETEIGSATEVTRQDVFEGTLTTAARYGVAVKKPCVLDMVIEKEIIRGPVASERSLRYTLIVRR